MTHKIFNLSKPAVWVSLSIGAALIATQPAAFAQSSSSSSAEELEEVIINAHPLHEKGLSQSVEVLRGTELADALQSNLGATLAQQPGVRNASFGAAVGRPVIRGLGGPRVKTTEDQIDSLDVSVTSTDHLVTVEPFIAEQITVLKGASTLLYGAGAIGGVVDVETGRIAKQLNQKDLSGRAEIRVGDNEDARTAAARLDGNIGDSLTWHLDAFSRESDDYEIPGFAESARFRAAEEAEEAEAGGEGEEGEEEVFGVLEGSRYDVEGGAGGLSWVGERGHLGISISTTDATYGLVGGHEEEEEEEGESEEPEGEEGPGIIELEQTRIDLSGELLSPFAGIESISARIGINDYEHVELEGNGEVGTVFDNDAWEARIFAKHEPIAGFTGVFGLQLGDREFSAIGEEAFVPPAETQTAGLFWVGEREFNTFSLELGARFDDVDTESLGEGGNVARDFSTQSASVGFVIPQSEASTWSVLFDYSERAPSIEELFSNGPHLATSTFEIGDTSLDEETALSFNVSWAYETDAFDAHVSFYRNDFDGFIFQANTGEEEDGLPVFVYRQNDAEFVGLDIELGVHLIEIAGGDLDLRATYDTVSADINVNGEENLPRIPADRFGVELVWNNELWRGKISYSDVNSQNDVAPFELATDGYEDISVKLERTFTIGESTLKAFIQGRNLSDDEQRAHTSFVKDFAPAPGRSVEAGLRFNF